MAPSFAHLRRALIPAVVRILGGAMLSAAPLAGAAGGLRLEFTPSPVAQVLAGISQRQKTCVVPRCAAAPRLDGEPTDSSWSKASRFALTPSEPTTTVQACYDDGGLYLLVTCVEPEGYVAAGRPHPRDGDAWKDDCLEIFFNVPHGGDETRYQFVINRAGAINDIRNGASTYNPVWQYAARPAATGWVAELAIPYAALELDAAPARLNFNVGRTGPNLPARSWALPYHDAAGGMLMLQGVPEHQAAEARPVAGGSPFVAIQGTSLQVRLERSSAWPGERWLEAELFLRPRQTLDRTRLEIRLFSLDREKPLESIVVQPERAEARLRVSLRNVDLDKAAVTLRFFEEDDCTGAARLLVSQQACPRPILPGERIPVRLDSPPAANRQGRWPVTFGLPFPAGALWDERQVRLCDRDGKEIPAQTEIVGRWAPEGAIKWLRVDALVSPEAGCFAEIGPVSRTAVSGPEVTVKERDDVIQVDTGAARFVLGSGHSPIREIWLGSRCVAQAAGGRGLYVVDQQGRLGSASATDARIEIEARGPTAACVRFEGWYKTAAGDDLARHITRVELFAGQSVARVTHTLVLTEDTNRTWFRDVGWEFSVAPGEKPEALFGISAREPARSTIVPLDEGAGAYMLQDSHYRFNHGTNHFGVVSQRERGEDMVLEGEECGDWASLRGQDGGLLVGCRDAARQHPKEFEVTGDRVTLRLFSGRAGEELDYRTTTLMRNWNLPAWIEYHNTRGGRVQGAIDEASFIAEVKAYVNNAAGGAKTHDLCVGVFGAGAEVDAPARLGALHSRPIYALADPQWLHSTQVMGPNYPRDPQRFPAAEQTLDKTVQLWLDMNAAWGEYGYIDYGAGPHSTLYTDDRVPILYRYVTTGYHHRSQVWLVYARSGAREVRDYAAASNRAQLDNCFMHWGPSTGVYRQADTRIMGKIPIYWRKGQNLELFGEFPTQFIWQYYLTGDRRIKDGLLEYANALNKTWTPGYARSRFFGWSLPAICIQFYGFTEDARFLAMARQTFDWLIDPASEVRMVKRAYDSSTYKNYQAIRDLIQAWWVYPSVQLRDLCLAVAGYEQQFPYEPCGYTPAGSIVGNFLYEQTRDPAQAQSLACAVQALSGLYDPATDELQKKKVNEVYTTSFLFSLGYALDVLVRAGAAGEGGNAASWLYYADYLGSARAFVRKGTDEAVRLACDHGERPRVRCTQMGFAGTTYAAPYDQGLIRVAQRHSLIGDIVIPKDVSRGEYEVAFAGVGPRSLFASSRAQMVLYAPDYWQPLAQPGPSGNGPHALRSSFKYYFNVPPDTAAGRIFFAGTGRLVDPGGEAWQNGDPLHGWIDLPADRPGLWAFIPVEAGLVRVLDIPPFFAFNDPRAYFEPQLAWREQATTRAEPPLPAAALYVPGASGAQGNQALYLSGRKYLQVKPPPGEEGEFFPTEQGTLEFHFRPNWDFYELGAGNQRGLAAAPPNLFVSQYAEGIRAYWQTKGPAGRDRAVNAAAARPSMLLRDRWTHIALVWGESETVSFNRDGVKKGFVKKLELVLYLDGHQASRVKDSARLLSAEEHAFAPWSYLVIGGLGESNRLDGAIDNLRISDGKRYTADFAPPPPESDLPLDRRTRALFRFNGSLTGQGYGIEAPLEAQVRQ